MDYDREYRNSYRDRYNEETSAEFAHGSTYDRRDDVGVLGSGSVYSYIGIVFAILSLFVMPTTFAVIAIVLGVVGLVKRSIGLGTTAIVLGAISLMIQFFWTSFL